MLDDTFFLTQVRNSPVLLFQLVGVFLTQDIQHSHERSEEVGVYPRGNEGVEWKFTSILLQYTVGGSCTHEEKQSSISNVNDYTMLRPICGNLSVGNCLRFWTTSFESHNKSRILFVYFLAEGTVNPSKTWLPTSGSCCLWRFIARNHSCF